MITQKKYYFFLGIGGIGMSALARYLRHFGKNVYGYDAVRTDLTKQLENEGITVVYEDNPQLLPDFFTPDNTLVIRTPAVRKGTLLEFFTKNAFKVLKRAEFLAQIANDNPQIAIAGTHGKTTTTAIATHIMKIDGKLKAGFVGGITKNYGSNLVLGNGEYVVLEADEYDRAFLLLEPDIAVVTTVEADHLDIYGDEQNLRRSFGRFLQQVRDTGHIILNVDVDLQPERKVYRYSSHQTADFYAENIRYQDGRQYFTLHLPGNKLDTFINFPGKAYLENAIAASAAAYLAGADLKSIAAGLETYSGTERRFDLKYNGNGKVIYDDYAHHPTELEALYEALRRFYPDRKITVVFQPHLYSRTRDFAPEFGRVLSKFDLVVVTDIYPAREEPIEGVDPQLILSYTDNPNKIYVTKQELADFLVRTDFEVLAVVGAGDVNGIVKPLIQKIRQSYEGE